MGFKDLKLDIHYDSEKSDLLKEFYIPVLSQASEYYRAVGFFNSKSLSTVAVGLKDFILNNGKMKLICGANLSPMEVKSIIAAERTPEEVLSLNFINDIDNIEDYIRENHIKVLGWMVANNLLEIKIAIKLDSDGNPLPSYDGMLHYKLGILKDFNGDYLDFSGSNNESDAGWTKNFEHFDVFRSWESTEYLHLLNHIKLFIRTWESSNDEYEVLDIPQAVERKLIDIAPENFSDLKFTTKKEKDEENCLELFDYQNDASDCWLNAGKRGIFAMATGTGKTYTALGCLNKLMDEEEKLITFISVPYQHLIKQWKNSIESFGLMSKIDKLIIADGTNPKKYAQIESALLDVDFDYMDYVLVIITHDSLPNEKLRKILMSEDFDFNFLLIGDEMHGLGSTKRRTGLLDVYNYRLGLSATPQRYFDDFGTDFLFDYFGDEVFTFSLKDAIEEINPLTNLPYLTSYYYHPYFLNLDEDELEEYNNLNFQILVELNKKKPNYELIERKTIARSLIIKNAKDKFNVLREILSQLDDKNNLLIFCSEKQIDKVVDIAGNEFNMSVRTFTNKNGTVPKKEFGYKSEREVILDDFSKGIYSAIVSIHCLDEGVDVPSASKAILMCNSTNPREFIQRVGRVIRRSDNKTFAEIYDMLIRPSSNSEFKEIEKSIYQKELNRSDLIGSLSLNKSEYYIKISKGK